MNTPGIETSSNLSISISTETATSAPGTYIVRLLSSFGSFKNRIGDHVTKKFPTFDSTIYQVFVSADPENLG